jgi:hypothetical protein
MFAVVALEFALQSALRLLYLSPNADRYAMPYIGPINFNDKKKS